MTPETPSRARAFGAAALLLCATGAAVRVLAAFPSFRHPLQSDATMTGLTAFELLRGEPQAFICNGTRLGAFESYLHVPVFALFGASRATLHVVPFLLGVALLVAFAALARELLGPKAGLMALLLVAVPSPVFLVWNVLPFPYVDVLLFITVALWLAVRIAQRGLETRPALGFGLAVGLGWWSSALSLAGTLPAVLWIVLNRPALLRSRRFSSLAAAGFAVGALPWLIANVASPLVSFGSGNFAFQSAGGWERLLDNAGRLAREVLPALLLRPEGPRPGFLARAAPFAGGLHAGILAITLLVIFLPRSWRGEGGSRRVPQLLLPLLVAGCTGALFVASSAGSIPGDVVRYVLPIGLAAPLILAYWIAQKAARDSVTAALALLLLLGVHVAGYDLPWGAQRAEERRLARAEDRLAELLARRRVAWVFGSYWDVYSLNFLSGETIRAIPDVPAADYHGYGRALGSSPVPFALVSREPGAAAALARRAGLTGETVSVDGAFEVFLVTPGPTSLAPGKQVTLLRRALAPAPLPPAAMRSRIERLDGAEAIRLAPGGQRKLRLRLTHAGRGAPWVSTLDRAPQGTVRLSVRWLRGNEVAAEQRAELPRSLAPGESAEIALFLTARDPRGEDLPPGSYEVRIGLVQEMVRRFEETGGIGDGTLRVPVEVK